MNPEELKKSQDETQEAILNIFMPNDPKQFFQSVSEVQRGSTSNSASAASAD